MKTKSFIAKLEKFRHDRITAGAVCYVVGHDKLCIPTSAPTCLVCLESDEPEKEVNQK